MNWQVFDSSVLIPWLRNRTFDDLVARAFQRRRFLLCAVVWMELYAGTQHPNDKRELDAMQRELSRVERVVSPEPEDFYLAGQLLGYYSRAYGRIEPRDHASDVLIALCASRAHAELVTVNADDMRRWRHVMRRFGRRLDLQVVEL